MSSHGDLHDYIHGVLETGHHGPYRIISFDLLALNDVIQTHAKRIGTSNHCILCPTALHMTLISSVYRV
jgi:hypothetical protein